jgi:geranylgeranyl diphosphate synthase, type II
MHPSVTPDSPSRQVQAIPDRPERRHHQHVTRLRTVEGALQDIIGDASATSASMGFGYRRLWSTLADATEGGKRFRSGLFTAAYRAWGGTDPNASATVGAAIELLHTAFVVHDDVIDGDDTRRGRPNVSGSHLEQARNAGVEEQRAREYASAAGILAGDLALAAALRTLASVPTPQATVLRLFDLFDSALHTTAAGELEDVWMSLCANHPTLPEILATEERKTSAYSFTLPLQAGAALAGASECTVESAGEVGRLLGIAFQLADDLLGVFGDPAATGKSVLSDLRAGKQTPLIAHARSTVWWHEIEPYVGRADLTAAQASWVRELLTASGSQAFVLDLADDYAQGALTAAVDMEMPSSLVSWVGAMTTDLLGRVR